MLFFTALVLSVYFLLNVVLVWVWWNMPQRQQKGHTINFSIIIPVRNEAQHILNLLQDLEAQHYPKNQYEVIVANDDSSDDTALIVEEFAKIASFSLILNDLSPETKSTSPKKRAIQDSISIAQFDTLITTDGDCRVGENWLASIAACYETSGAYLVSSPVTFQGEKGFFEIFQTIEFASLIGTGACSMFLKKPNMCNGANLSYRKTAYEAVGGFSGSEQVASGDDEFLMHKIAKNFPDKVQFWKAEDAIVCTQAHTSFSGFVQQRRRWASKWSHYQHWQVTALAVFIFTSNLLTAISLILVFFDGAYAYVLGLKFSAELVFLSLVLYFLGKQRWIVAIPFVQGLYPFYVVFVGLLAQRKGYVWKGRNLE